MANTFSNLVANAYKELDVVSREMVGFVNSVTLDANASAIPIGQTLYSFETPAAGASTGITPAVTPPDDGDQTIGSKTITITEAVRQPFRWAGEEERALNTGAGAGAVQSMQLQQAIRRIVNDMETFVFGVARKGASRAYGTAGTTPFASSLADAAAIQQILDDNGADGARSMVLNSNAVVNLRGLTQLTKANEAGTEMTLRDGELLDIFGLSFKQSAAGRTAITKGTGASWLVNGALTAGATTIVCDGGSGTILAGDVVTFAGDTNKYVVATALSGGSFTINAPGLIGSVADNAAITVGNNFSANVAFSQTAIVLAARTPYVPEGEMAINQEIITDPRSGISMRLAQYANYHRVQYEVSACYGATVIKPAHTALLLG